MLTLKDVFKKEELNLSEKQIIDGLARYGNITKKDKVYLKHKYFLDKFNKNDIPDLKVKNV